MHNTSSILSSFFPIFIFLQSNFIINMCINFLCLFMLNRDDSELDGFVGSLPNHTSRK
jgi:hypothetical protein